MLLVEANAKLFFYVLQLKLSTTRQSFNNAGPARGLISLYLARQRKGCTPLTSTIRAYSV